jgi:pimeloyl-ACP methyl ester carboxylesterase
MHLAPYRPRRQARSSFVTLRGLRHHLLQWEAPAGEQDASPSAHAEPLLVLMHGWMDVAASFQFVVDALAGHRRIVAADWRGFGLTGPSGADSYAYADYLGDLDALLDHVSPDAPVDLVGHSMGGNVVMVYAGVRPQRVRKLVSLEGFGLPATRAAQAPTRYAQWLDELKQPQALRDYASLDEVAQRLMKNNPRLRPDRAAWLAPHWSRESATGRWVIQGDPAHKRTNPVLYRVDEVLACWARIAAPMLWVEGRQTDMRAYWGDRYPRSEFEERLRSVPRVTPVMLDDAGHMLHHDQPERLAEHLQRFLGADA